MTRENFYETRGYWPPMDANLNSGWLPMADKWQPLTANCQPLAASIHPLRKKIREVGHG